MPPVMIREQLVADRHCVNAKQQDRARPHPSEVHVAILRAIAGNVNRGCPQRQAASKTQVFQSEYDCSVGRAVSPSDMERPRALGGRAVSPSYGGS